MNLVTWNVNSVRARAERVQRYLAEEKPDVLCIQETKVEDASFPRELFEGAGYEIAIFGQKTYNGVAIASKLGLADVVNGLPGEGPEAEKRTITASVAGLRIVNVYVPNGQALDSPKYPYKLEWFKRLAGYAKELNSRGTPVVICGDFNVAPEDRDVHDPEAWRGQVLFSDPEKAALRALFDLGFTDLFRTYHQDAGQFSWWDYRMLGFPKNKGLRIDLILTNPAATTRARSTHINRNERKGQGASDHAPVHAQFD